MRYLASFAIVLLWACGGDDGDSSPKTDASTTTMSDARLIDAPTIIVDAPPDAANTAITSACTNICNALGVCFMDTDPGCVGECSADLADCTAQQVQAVDDCKNAACGDENNSPIFTCISAIGCIDG